MKAREPLFWSVADVNGTLDLFLLRGARERMGGASPPPGKPPRPGSCHHRAGWTRLETHLPFLPEGSSSNRRSTPALFCTVIPQRANHHRRPSIALPHRRLARDARRHFSVNVSTLGFRPRGARIRRRSAQPSPRLRTETFRLNPRRRARLSPRRHCHRPGLA